MPLLKIDMHVHTVRSKDAHTRVEDLPDIIKRKGLDGVAITEHDNYDPPKVDALILPGIEVSTSDGHVIGLGVGEAVPPRLSADETITRIHELGGIAIVPHPYDPVCECVKLARLKVLPEAIETVNADALSFYFSNWFAKRDAQRFGLPQVGGSDSHIPQSIGDAYTVVDSATRSVKDVIEAIKMGRVRPEGHATSAINKLRKLKFKFA